MTRYLICMAAGILLAAAPAVQSQNRPPTATIAAQPRGVYASIDLRPAQEMIGRLQASSGTVRRPAMREVLKDPSVHMPPVLYALANALAGDNPEQAIFWYMVGRLRAVYDGLRHRDVTVRSGVNTLGQQLNLDLRRSMFYQRNQLNGIAARSVEWDGANARNYDHRWIALYGKLAHETDGADSAITLPESEWPAILKHVHEAHLQSVAAFVAQRPSN